MKSTLLTHARNYPEMEPRDAVKLIYQSEFGGGHLIQDEAGCLRFLRQEYESTTQDPDCPLLEYIGSNMFRVNLAALDTHNYPAEELGRDFIRSASLSRGNMEGFLCKLTLLADLTRDRCMPFSPEALEIYLSHYKSEGYPPVSHSEAYRRAYHPAYRVVEKSCIPEKHRMR